MCLCVHWQTVPGTRIYPYNVSDFVRNNIIIAQLEMLLWQSCCVYTLLLLLFDFHVLRDVVNVNVLNVWIFQMPQVSFCFREKSTEEQLQLLVYSISFFDSRLLSVASGMSRYCDIAVHLCKKTHGPIQFLSFLLLVTATSATMSIYIYLQADTTARHEIHYQLFMHHYLWLNSLFSGLDTLHSTLHRIGRKRK